MTHSTQPQPVMIKINLKKVTVRLVLLKQNILFTQRQKYDLPLDKNIQLFAICETTLFSLRIKSTTCLFSIQYSVVCNWCNNFTRKKVFFVTQNQKYYLPFDKSIQLFSIGETTWWNSGSKVRPASPQLPKASTKRAWPFSLTILSASSYYHPPRQWYQSQDHHDHDHCQHQHHNHHHQNDLIPLPLDKRATQVVVIIVVITFIKMTTAIKTMSTSSHLARVQTIFL